MELKELFSSEVKDIIQTGVGAIDVIANPKCFIETLQQENSATTAKRILFVATAYSVIELLLICKLDNLGNAWPLLIRMGLFESSFALVLAFIIALALFCIRFSRPLKTAFGFVFTGRYIFLAPAMICNGLFLNTEEYIFAYPRGIFGYMSLLLVFIILPFSLKTRLWKRLVVIFLITILWFSYAWVISTYIVKSNHETSALNQTSIFFDPIGQEIEDKIKLYGIDEQDAPASFNFIRFLKYDIIETNGHKTVKYKPETVEALLSQWKIDKDSFYILNKRKSEEIKAEIENSQFKITKNLLKIKLRELNAANDIGQILDTFPVQGSQVAQISLNRLTILMKDLIIRRLEIENAHYRSRVPLMKIAFLSYSQ